MAKIIPFKAWRYHQRFNEQIKDLTSPLFDVVSQKYRRILYQNPHNSIHLSVPAERDPVEVLQDWKREKVIVQDLEEGIYPYYQYFYLPNSQKKYCRKGFMVLIKAYGWNQNVVLRHESTIPAAVNDRIELLSKTQVNVSPTHGLYKDTDFELEKYMDKAIENPLYQTEDYQGVIDKMAVITDKKIIQKFINKIADKKIILADGHHRYEGSLAYRQQQKELNPNHTGEEGYNYHLMYLTNSCADDLRILPTHRLVKGIENIDENQILEKVSEYFTIKPVGDAVEVNDIILGKKWAFGLIFKENAYKIRLKPDKIAEMTWKFPAEIKELDPTVLHYFFIEKVLGIEGKDQRSSPNIDFERNFTECLSQVIQEKSQMALIMNEVKMETVEQVCQSGYTMPQKSTYFYPKAICGFLFASIGDKY